MSTTDLPTGSAFRNLETGEGLDRPPTSKMAILALAAGAVSLFAPLSFVMLPLSILAIALGAVVLWRISRDAAVGGTRLAQLGLGLGVLSGAWTITATTSESKYLYEHAGKNAKIYLETLAAGNVYDALELRVPKNERQIAGTNLEQFYRQQTGESADRALEVINSPAVKAVIAEGKQADWQYSKGISILADGTLKSITVEMVNRNKPTQAAHVTLRRRAIVESDGRAAAMWMVSDTVLENANSNRL